MEGSKGKADKSFESAWAERLSNAEAQPAEHVWKSISGELANQQIGSYRKRAIYYKWAAAACLVIAAALGALYYNNSFNATNHDLVANTQNTDQEVPARSGQPSRPADSNETSEKLPSVSSDDLTNKGQVALNEINDAQNDTGVSIGIETIDQEPARINDKESAPALSILVADLPMDDEIVPYDENNSKFELSDIVEIFPLAHHSAKDISLDELMGVVNLPDRIYGVPIYGNAENKEEENERELLWAGLNMGSGSFDPNYGPPTGSVNESALSSEDAFAPALDANTAGLPLREESNSGPSISVGIDVGTAIGKRWVVQTGLSYGRFRVNTNTNLVFSSADQSAVPLSFQNREALFSEEEVTISNQNLDVDNNFQLLSIPVKAGFILIDRKFNVLINAGLASDWYLGNSLNSSEEGFARYDISPGSDSPYRRVHLSGLTSIQLGYKILDNYYLSVEPNYRKSITDFAKTGNSFSSRPSGMGLIVGFRYLFR